MTDEKKEFRINAVDVLITVLLLGLIAVCTYMIANAFDVDATAGENDLTVTYTLQFKGLEDIFADKVQPGDAVVDAQKRLKLGTVVSVSSEPYVKDVYSESLGKMVAVEHPDCVTVNITIQASGSAEDGMIYVNGIKMGVGAGLMIHTKNFCGTGYISAMDVQ